MRSRNSVMICRHNTNINFYTEIFQEQSKYFGKSNVADLASTRLILPSHMVGYKYSDSRGKGGTPQTPRLVIDL